MKDKTIYNRPKRVISAIMAKGLNKKNLQEELERNGISVIFRENEDRRIYGVTFIDHQDKAVIAKT